MNELLDTGKERRLAAGKAFGDSEDTLKLLIADVRDYAIILLDTSGRIMTWNAGAERIKGYSESEVIGRHFTIFYTQEDMNSGKAEIELRIAREEGRFEDEGWRVRKDGNRFWANVVITAIRNAEGTLLGYGKLTRDITERKIIEASLRESEERYRMMINGVRDYAIIMLSRSGQVVSWNEGAERIKGYRRDEILGRNFSIFFPEEDIAAGAPERELELAAQEGSCEYESWRVRKDGSRFWANIIITAVRDSFGTLTGYTKVTRDITERKRADDELRYSEERFRLMVESVKDYALFTLDPEGIVVSWNPGAERLKQYKTSEIVGQHFSIFYPPADRGTGKPAAELETARREGRFEEEGWRARKDGSLFWANVVLSVQKDHLGRTRGFTKVTRDMTERKRAEDEQRALMARLIQSNRELEHFASVASHDLQEPLRKIQAFGNQLEVEFGDKLEDDAKFYVERMRAAAQRMRGLIDDLLAFSRVSNQERKLSVVDLSEVVRSALSDLETRIAETGGKIEVGALPAVEGDMFQMQQLFLNLIGNALKFSRPGVPPVIKVHATPSTAGGVQSTVLTVQDNGIGFDLKYRERIFTLFQRLHSKDKYEGTGLGLSICRRIVERHGGSIEVQSQLGEGSTFVVTLPVRQPFKEPIHDGR